MKTQPLLTEYQLNEVAELAKTKSLKEIASHFHISTDTLRSLRTKQPEIDIIYQRVTEEQRNKIYTAEEIVSIGDLAQEMNLDNVAKHLEISRPRLIEARRKQPELDDALTRGVNNRSSNFDALQKASNRAQAEEGKASQLASDSEPEDDSERLYIRAPEDISPEEAVKRFYRLKKEEKERQIAQELKDIDL